ncbi:uncharacterized protein ACA1_396110 [Acanthamoeba castellanii str. Neff]|uniref:Methyltransferase domain containing protein n=1 Tax=Acanthamoeba castellanii (strain ATCC 30010 / Neff) TaxID=1257118 RepID=L8HEI8_ACACF|nr:uncharacterized protein ACA1_396110 [Acanthamoeba castellanii str. Neff]ELR22826.1 hypothetical protein ACA1_396110 [Acanthamoeba castellanii str. Neff]
MATSSSNNTREDFDPPIVLGGGLFAQDDDDSDDDLLSAQEVEEEARLGQQKSFLFADLNLEVRELGYSATNAAYVWPNGGRLATLLSSGPPRPSPLLLELGSGTGILSIYLRRKGWHVVSSDYDEAAIEENIAHNCRLNDVPHHHVPHTWGTPFPFDLLRARFAAIGDTTRHDVDVVAASDILLYAEQYDNLVDSLGQLFRHAHEAKLARRREKECEEGAAAAEAEGLVVEGTRYGYPVFLLNVARRLKSTPDFFAKMERAGFEIHHLRDVGSNVAITHTRFNSLAPHT